MGNAAVLQYGGGEAGFGAGRIFGEGIAVVVDAQVQSGGQDAVCVFVEPAVQMAGAPAEAEDDEGEALFLQKGSV